MKGISDMLVLSRKQNQAIIIDSNIRITVVSIRGNQVRIGIEAPEEVGVFREELLETTAPPKDKSQPGKPRAVSEFAQATPIKTVRHEHAMSSVPR
jgi:carbon storage regulator